MPTRDFPSARRFKPTREFFPSARFVPFLWMVPQYFFQKKNRHVWILPLHPHSSSQNCSTFSCDCDISSKNNRFNENIFPAPLTPQTPPLPPTTTGGTTASRSRPAAHSGEAPSGATPRPATGPATGMGPHTPRAPTLWISWRTEEVKGEVVC